MEQEQQQQKDVGEGAADTAAVQGVQGEGASGSVARRTEDPAHPLKKAILRENVKTPSFCYHARNL